MLDKPATVINNNIYSYFRYAGILLFSLCIALPLPRHVSSSAFILMVANVLLLDYRKLDFTSLKDGLAILFLLFFFIDGIRSFFDNNVVLDEAKLAFAVVPVLFLLKKKSLEGLEGKIMVFFMLGVTIYIGYAWSYAAYFYTIKYPHYELSILDGYLIYLFDFHLPGSLHHNYIGWYMAFGIAVIYGRTVYSKTMSMKTGFLLTIFFSLNLFFIGSKTTSITLLLLLMAITAAAYRNQWSAGGSYKLLGILLVVLVMAIVVMWSWVPYSVYSSIDKRVDIYRCSFQVASENFWTGVGFNHIEGYGSTCAGFNQPLIPHNAFVHELLANGVTGLLLLTAIFARAFVKARRLEPAFASLLVLTLAVSMVEDILTRQRGAMFFAFFTMLLYIGSPVLQTMSRPRNEGNR